MPAPISKKIKAIVLSIHAVFLCVIFFGSSLPPVKKKHKPLIVKTIAPTSAVPITQPLNTTKSSLPVRSEPPEEQMRKIEKLTSPAKALAPKTKAVKAEISSSPQPPLKKDSAIADKMLSKNAKASPKKDNKPDNRGKISEQLRKELEASIAKIEEKKQTLAQKQQPASSQTFTPIQLHIDSIESGSSTDMNLNYPNLMIGYLRQSLHLPEFGEVKIQLTLRQDGSVAKLVVLNTESEKNGRYLEESLPHLKFPSFNGSFAKKKEHTFVLTFCNEI